MELTAQTLREVEFREKLRGYHPDDVDDFLEQAAVAVEDLLARLRQAEAIPTPGQGSGPTPLVRPDQKPDQRPDQRPDQGPDQTADQPADQPGWSGVSGSTAAPVGVAPSSPSGVSEHTLQRTLLLAQQTADAAIADAQSEAARILEGARDEARRLTEEAQAHVADLRSESQSRAAQSLAELEEQRAGLEHEVVALRSWAMQQRDRLREALTGQVRSLDIWLSASAPPVTSSPGTTPIGGPDGAIGDPSSPGGPGGSPPDEPASEPDQPTSEPVDHGPASELVDHEAEPGWLEDVHDKDGEIGATHDLDPTGRNESGSTGGGLFGRR